LLGEIDKSTPISENETIVSNKCNIVKEFHQQHQISREIPNVRDVFRTKNDQQEYIYLPKKFLHQSISETYKLFKEEYPNFKVGLSKFSSLRPNNVKLAGNMPLVSCCCSVCENLTCYLMELSA
jgi:hypothetical protein